VLRWAVRVWLRRKLRNGLFGASPARP